MQNQHNTTENDNDVKLLLTHIKKMQNIDEVNTLVSNKTILSTKAVIERNKLDVSVEKVSCTTKQYNKNDHLYKKNP